MNRNSTTRTNDLGASHFSDFFESIHGAGKRPFPWQEALVRRVVDGDWPNAIALPTAAGKTACIDIAVFALAAQSNRLAGARTAPRRIFFVVDRRVIVDEAYERARMIAQRLLHGCDSAGRPSAIIKLVANRLLLVAGDDSAMPLECFQLRGGMYRDDAWARTPTQPTVIASTVDQIGSRLLYRSYGRSSKSWAVHAGLAANDSLIILDEAHCAIPFAQTMRAIQRYRTWHDGTLISPFHAVVMSATPPSGLDDVLTASDSDRSNQVLARRINAAKPANLVVAKKAKGAKALEVLADEIVRQAVELAAGAPRAIGVFVNRVSTAKMIYDRLFGKCVDQADLILLTGRMRSMDRDILLQQWRPRSTSSNTDGSDCGLLYWFGTSRDRPSLPRTAFVVATQCLEVGANIDFDCIVTECASFDALRQRFGRLNRMGRDIPVSAAIVIRADQVDPKEPDPVYGPSLPATWQWLHRHANAGRIDMGVAAVDALLPTDENQRLKLLEEIQLRNNSAPIMLPAYLDCWVQTAPKPEPSPDIAIFLHGSDRAQPEVAVCWRSDLEIELADADKWTETLSLCPPAAAECMPVPLQVFRRWWTSASELHLDHTMSDLEGQVAGPEQSPTPLEPPFRVALRWCGPEDEGTSIIRNVDEVRPGDTLVIPEAFRGWEEFGHIPTSEEDGFSVDIGDQVQWSIRCRPVIRLHRKLVERLPFSPPRERLIEIMAQSDVADPKKELLAVLIELAAEPTCPKWFAGTVRELQARWSRTRLLSHPLGGWVLHGPIQARARSRTHFEADTMTHEDETASATVAVSLATHTQNVTRRARMFASLCGLNGELLELVELAATLHDLGKGDSRFQIWLHNGNAIAALAAPALLAKSGGLPLSKRQRQQARIRAAYPIGGRHELISVRLAEGCAAVRALNSAQSDVVLHLIASHHGQCRPFAPVVMDKTPVLVEVENDGEKLTARSDTGLEQLDSGVAERFWRLVRRFGWWGIAWLESILILADHRASETEQRELELDKTDEESPI